MSTFQIRMPSSPEPSGRLSFHRHWNLATGERDEFAQLCLPSATIPIVEAVDVSCGAHYVAETYGKRNRKFGVFLIETSGATAPLAGAPSYAQKIHTQPSLQLAGEHDPFGALPAKVRSSAPSRRFKCNVAWPGTGARYLMRKRGFAPRTLPRACNCTQQRIPP
ncbi:hypothetical protein CBM2586_B130491 [Cupriavidus phytorum]|uniref:Uncharacterized protein n=1 Tax=Cupriavidus taiwanensis TaxID=164546 RepID=A0A375CIQ7_9BURK|nr:hypothetical protein CBM2586_B130491 [Cupriavidus taiwanensis]